MAATTHLEHCPTNIHLTYPADQNSPNPLRITDQVVEVYTQGFFGWRLQATLTSDENGDIALPENITRLSGGQTFELRFKEELEEYRGLLNWFHSDWRELWRHRVQVEDMDTKVNNFVLRTDILAYNEDGLPRMQDPENADHRYQVMNPSYLLRFGSSLLSSLVKRVSVTVSDFFWPIRNVADAMANYQLTDYSIERREQDVIDMIYNHLPPKDAIENPDGTIVFPHYFTHLDLDDSPQAPDVELVMRRSADDLLEIEKIRYKFKGEEEWTETLRNEGEEFTYALGIFASSAVLAGQLKAHLGRGHLLIEQMAMAFHRHIHKGSALFSIMSRFFQDVHIINRLGESAIFGPDSVLAGTSLTPQGAIEGLEGVLGSRSDYEDFSPRLEPFDRRDTLTPALASIWTAIDEAIETAFDANEADIAENWYQVEGMSEDLFRHSARYQALNGVEDQEDWFNWTEVSDPDKRREAWLGTERSVPRIVDPASPSPNNRENMERLKKWCKFSIFHVFWHDVIHNRQIRWSTNFSYASLMMEGRGRPEYHGTSVDNALHILNTARQFAGFTPRTLAQVAEREPDSFVAALYGRLEANKDDIEAAGIELHSIMDSVQV